MSNPMRVCVPSIPARRCCACDGTGRIQPERLSHGQELLCNHCDGSGRVVLLELEEDPGPPPGLPAAVIAHETATAPDSPTDRLLSAYRDILAARSEVRSLMPNVIPASVAWRYVATQGEELLDESMRLDDFVKEMADGADDGDIAIWRVLERGTPQLVALVRPTPGGSTVFYV